jgi:hypothetical protein
MRGLPFPASLTNALRAHSAALFLSAHVGLEVRVVRYMPFGKRVFAMNGWFRSLLEGYCRGELRLPYHEPFELPRHSLPMTHTQCD